MKVIGEPDRPVEVAVRVLAPATVPRVHAGEVAMPEPLVVTAPDDASEPPPDATANVTATPDTRLPTESVTSTEGAFETALPAVPLWLLPAFTAMIAAGPTPFGVMFARSDVRPADSNVNVFVDPTIPAKVRFVNVAVPATAATPVDAWLPPSVPLDAETVTVAVEDVRFLH